MNEVLQTKLTELLDLMTNSIKTAVDFSVYQVSDVISQYIIFYGVMYTLWFIVAIVGVYKLFGFTKNERVERKALENAAKYDDEVRYGLMQCGAYTAQLVLIGTGVYAGYWGLMVWVAPKVFLITRMADLYSSIK